MTDQPTPPSVPFSPTGRVRSQAWQVPISEAVAAAETAGFRVTPQSSDRRVVVQRDWKTAATITPHPAGVVVKRSLTLAQLVIVGAVVVLLIVGLCGPGMFES